MSVASEPGGRLGWCARKEKADYSLPIPQLSEEEEGLICEVEAAYKEVSKSKELSSAAEVGECIAGLIADYCSENALSLDSEQEKYLPELCLMHIYGFAVLEPLLADKNIEEIALIGLNKPIYIYLAGKGWKRTNAYITSSELAISLMNKMARQLGRRITLQTPRLNAVLPDGSRMHASIPPISHLELTIRKFRENPLTVADLIRLKTFTADSLAFLWLMMQSDLSVLVCGNTASGKTTTLNSLFSFVNLSERVLISEETPEINIPHQHSVRLLSNEELGIKLSELAWDSLRMRPDRVIVGEVRTPDEVAALIETLLAGQARGSYATFHAQSAKEAMLRMRSLGVLESDLAALDLVIVQRRMMRYSPKTRESREIRRATEISEVDKSAPLSLKPLFEYDSRKDALVRRKGRSQLLERVAANFGIGRAGLEKELKRRAKFLSSLASSQPLRFDAAVQKIQKFAFGD